jgi:hypothetical protein
MVKTVADWCCSDDDFRFKKCCHELYFRATSFDTSLGRLKSYFTTARSVFGLTPTQISRELVRVETVFE